MKLDIYIRDYTDNGNPLEQEKGIEPLSGRVTVGWKLFWGDEAYGDYLVMPDIGRRDDIEKAVCLMLNQAYQTKMCLQLGEELWSP